ncbi:UNVERIFIED_CONTAM: hypothetical protein Slati_2484900, partial [Sesamum latifolium]
TQLLPIGSPRSPGRRGRNVRGPLASQHASNLATFSKLGRPGLLVYQVTKSLRARPRASQHAATSRPPPTATCCGRDLEIARARCEQQACSDFRSATTRASFGWRPATSDSRGLE